MKHFFFFSSFLIVSSLFSAQEYIDDEIFSEKEELYESTTAALIEDFFSKCKEEDKVHNEPLLTEKKEDVLINRYNKRIDKLAHLLKKKIERINFIYEQEVNKEKEEFTQDYGKEKIIQVRHKKSLITASHKKRTDQLIDSFKKIYEKILTVHNQLEEKVNTYYLETLHYEIKNAYQNTLKALEKIKLFFDNPLTQKSL